MTYLGVVKGKTIELNEPLPFREGQSVSVSVEPVAESLPLGSPARLLRALHEPPHVTADDVDALMRAIEEGKLPVNPKGVFDDEGNR